MTTKRSTTPKKTNKGSGLDFGQFFLFMSDVVTRIGLPGFIVVFIATFVTCYASERQKEAIIERWVLFNNNSQLQSFTILVICLAVTIYIVEAYTFSKIRKLDREEITRLAEYKNKYQELMSGKVIAGNRNNTNKD